MSTLASQYAEQITAQLPKLGESRKALEDLLTCITNVVGTDGIPGMASITVLKVSKDEALADLELTHAITLDQIEKSAKATADLVFQILDDLAAEFHEVTGYTVDGTAEGFGQAFACEQKEHDQNEELAKAVKAEITEAMTKLNLGDPATIFAPKPAPKQAKVTLDPKKAAKESLNRVANFFVTTNSAKTDEVVEPTPGWQTDAVINENLVEYKRLKLIMKILNQTNGDTVAAKNLLAQRKLEDNAILDLFGTLWSLADKQFALSAAIRSVAKADYGRFQSQAASAKLVLAVIEKVSKFFNVKL